MSAEHEIAAPAGLVRIEVASPWLPPLPRHDVRWWFARLADAWREGMALYVRACMRRDLWEWSE